MLTLLSQIIFYFLTLNFKVYSSSNSRIIFRDSTVSASVLLNIDKSVTEVSLCKISDVENKSYDSETHLYQKDLFKENNFIDFVNFINKVLVSYQESNRG